MIVFWARVIAWPYLLGRFVMRCLTSAVSLTATLLFSSSIFTLVKELFLTCLALEKLSRLKPQVQSFGSAGQAAERTFRFDETLALLSWQFRSFDSWPSKATRSSIDDLPFSTILEFIILPNRQALNQSDPGAFSKKWIILRPRTYSSSRQTKLKPKRV